VLYEKPPRQLAKIGGKKGEGRKGESFSTRKRNGWKGIEVQHFAIHHERRKRYGLHIYNAPFTVGVAELMGQTSRGLCNPKFGDGSLGNAIKPERRQRRGDESANFKGERQNSRLAT
jgi:hypothetical protein